MPLALALLWLVQAVEHPPVIPAEAEIVHVEALVTDKKGRPVPGLSVDDFVVYEDGRPVPIVVFAAPRAASLPTAEPRAAAGLSALPSDVLEPSTIVVYVDNRNLSPGGRRRVLAGLGPALEEGMASRSERVLVLSEERGTRALFGLTDDPAELRRALAAAEVAPAQGHLARSEERTTIDLVKTAIEMARLQMPPVPCSDILPQLLGIVRQYAQARTLLHQETFARLADVSAALGALPGEKALLFLTENLEQAPGLQLFNQLGDICPEILVNNKASELLAAEREFDLSRAFQELAARANAARVTIYPLDGRGLTTYSAGDVSQESRRYTPTARNDAVRNANLKAGPWILAEETGGTAVFDSNRPAAVVGSISREMDERYSLGFTPQRGPDGRRHSLGVEVKRKGLEVRHRQSYFHAPTGEAQVKRTYASLLLGYEQNDLGATIEAVASAVEGSSHVERGVHIALPLARLVPRADDDGRTAQVRITMLVRKADEPATAGGAVARETTVDVPLPSTSVDGETATHDIVVRLPPADADQEVAVGVRDLVGGAATYKRLRVAR
jgi:VWFA-related protein